jgi:uncharacterized membrane protein YqgA involved in biofilm formation
VPGLGTLINIVAILLGSAAGVLFGARLPERTHRTVTDALGLVVLVIGALNVAALENPDFKAAVGSSAPLLIVLGALLIGGVIGSLVGIENRVEVLGGWLQRRLSGETEDEARARFIEGFVASSLLFCIGPLAILGSLSDGLGNGIDQLALKSVLDGFAAMGFAAALGWGVSASAIPVGVWQGSWTLAAVLAGSLLPVALVAAITATGGVLLLGIGFRLLNVRRIAVADMLPALLVAPLLTLAVQAVV